MAKPRLTVRQIQGVTVVDFLDKDINVLDEITVTEISVSLLTVAMEQVPIKFLLSFANVNYFSSALLGTLLRLSKRVVENGGTFKLCSINPAIYQVFSLTKLDHILEIYEDTETAIRSFGE